MSKNTGSVIFAADREHRWIKYNATVEHCYPKLYDDPEDLAEDWNSDDWPICECGGAEPVTVFPYDVAPALGEKTISWPATACRRCRCLVTGLQGE